MAKPNYSFDKRQKELAKKKKKEDKRLKKMEPGSEESHAEQPPLMKDQDTSEPSSEETHTEQTPLTKDLDTPIDGQT